MAASYLYLPATDFRTGINGLAILVEQVLGMNPFAAAVYHTTVSL